VQRMFVAGLTLETSVPAPGGTALLAGVLGLAALRRRAGA
jgi:hypothetical protein